VAFNVMLDSLERNRISLEEAKEQVRRQKTLAEMGKFSLMIAHEFKNPLSIMKSSLDILKKDAGLTSENTMVFYIEDEIMRLNRLIGEFLTFSRPSVPSFCRTDLNAMLEEMVTKYELQHSGASCVIRSQIPSEPCYASVDRDLLIRAIGNIIKNALDANEDNGGVVQVTAVSLPDVWKVEVADQGKGIVPENMEKIFNPFFTTRVKGVGLGLAYASQAVKAHGGVIHVENSGQGGALFRIEIPLGKSGDVSPSVRGLGKYGDITRS
jgi:signal transduction histidine kinase